MATAFITAGGITIPITIVTAITVALGMYTAITHTITGPSIIITIARTGPIPITVTTTPATGSHLPLPSPIFYWDSPQEPIGKQPCGDG